MEKEIKVRKKRFVAFWVAVLLLCMLVMPKMTQKAEALEITDPVENQEIPVNEPITNSDGGCTVYYRDRDGLNIYTVSIGYGETHNALGADASVLTGLNLTAQETLKGWKVQAVANDSGFVNIIYLSPIIEEVIRTYTITFDTDGGNTIEPITVVVGAEITAPDDPEKTGYTFTGWDKEIPTTMPAEDMTITAKWTINRYTITFDTAGGSEIPPITQNYGTSITAPGDPIREGYTFAGWDEAVPTTIPAENLTITAQWTANRYSIRYILDGGINGENPGSYTYGTGVSGFADAVKPGYRFAGWYENADFSGEQITSVAANRTDDITLYAKFEMGTIEAGTYSLTSGVAYKLGNVTKVSGDNSVYTSGSTFYVTTSGTYTFS